MRCALMALCIVGAVASGAAGAAREKEALEQLRSRIEQAKKELAAAESAHSEVTDQLRASETAISETNRSLRDLAARQREARTTLRGIASDGRKVRSEIESREEQVGALVRAQYFTGERRLLKLLLSADNPNRIARSLTYYEYVFQAQNELIRGLRDRMARLATLEQSARAANAELADLERQAQAERAKLVATAEERRKVLASVARQISGQRREIESYQRDEKRLSRLVDELAKALRSVRPPAPRAGSGSDTRNERVPVAGIADTFSRAKGELHLPVRGELAGRFGAPRQGSSLTWKGVLILAPEGEEVRAVAPGRVVFADWMRGFGNLLILDHGENYLTIYGYNEAVLKKVGDPVHAGDVIATVGATGGAGTSGLYFEMRHEGKPFDPLTWVSLK